MTEHTLFEEEFYTLKRWVLESRRIVVFVGAGLSTESGVPDFRSENGVWQKYEPVYYQDFISSEAARKRYWNMKKESFALYKDVRPNRGHQFIYHLEETGQLLGLITQNVDGLHRLIGHSEEKFIEIHGTDRSISCLDCEKVFDAAPYYENWQCDMDAYRCDSCRGLLKPATISFGQSLRSSDLAKAAEWATSSDLFISMGSSLVVHPAASFPGLAKKAGVRMVIVNRDPTPYDLMADLVIHCEIGELAAFLLEI